MFIAECFALSRAASTSAFDDASIAWRSATAPGDSQKHGGLEQNAQSFSTPVGTARARPSTCVATNARMERTKYRCGIGAPRRRARCAVLAGVVLARVVPMSAAGQCLVSCLVGCLLIQIALRWGHPAICSVLPSEPWVNCHSSALSPPVSPTAAPQTVAAMAMSTAPLPDDVWRGDVPGDASNSSAGPLASWRSGSRHFVQEPFSWRRNRKKITELTVREQLPHPPPPPS